MLMDSCAVATPRVYERAWIRSMAYARDTILTTPIPKAWIRSMAYARDTILITPSRKYYRKSGHLPRAIDTASRRERPAGPTLAPVLDFYDSSGGLLAIVRVGIKFGEPSLGRSRISTDWQGLEFLNGQIAELVGFLLIGLRHISFVCLQIGNCLVVDALTVRNLITVVRLAERGSVSGEFGVGLFTLAMANHGCATMIVSNIGLVAKGNDILD